MPANEPFGYCLNTSTISGQKLSLLENIAITDKAGYGAIELWINELDAHVAKGGKLGDVKMALADAGITCESAIGFFDWVVDDDAQRAKGLEEAKRNLDMLAQIGGKRIAAPPCGAYDKPNLNLLHAAERYRALLELSEKYGVVPQVEFWGGSAFLHTLGEALLIAAEAGHPRSCVLGDVFHMYKGNSSPEGLRLLGPTTVQVLHVNDYPANPSQNAIGDGDRVWPGDGVAPLGSIFRTLRDIGFRGHLSLELFNKTYWAMDPLAAAKLGLEKTRAAVRAALA